MAPISPNQRDDAQRRDRRQARDRPDAEHRPLEQQVSRQEQCRTAEHGGHDLRAGVSQRVGDDQLVADGGDDDPGHHRDVEVGVGKPTQPSGIARRLEGTLRGIEAEVEIDPPECDAAQEGDDERRQRRPREIRLPKRRAGDQNRFAERNNEEELAPLRQVCAADMPVAGRGATQTGVKNPQAGPNESIATAAIQKWFVPDRGEPTGEPEQSGCRPPREDALKIAVKPWIVARRDDREREAADLQCHKRDRKEEPAIAERLGQGDRHDQGGHHDADQQKRTGRRSGSNQLVNQAVSTQAHHSASSNSAV